MHLFNTLTPQTIGIISLIGALAFLTGSDSIIKWLSPTYALHEIMLIRASFALVLTMVIVQLEGGIKVLKTRRPTLHALRAFLLVVANMFFFLGLSSMPLADAVAIFFAAPLFICILSQPILGEKVGIWRWLAILVGLVGVIVMLRPGRDTFSIVAILPLAAAFTYACMQMITRKLGMSDKASTMAFYIQITFIIVSALVGLGIGDGRFSEATPVALDFLFRAWSWPTSSDLMLMALCGGLVALGGYLISQAYRITAASVVAPFEYAAMPFAVFWGYQLWGDWPDSMTFLGSVLIIGSGLIILLSENRRNNLHPR